MKITQQNNYKNWAINKLCGLLYRLENTGDANFLRNGEANFINDIGNFYQNKNFTVFDIGANKGEYPELIQKSLHSTATSIHLFEPQKTCFSTLNEKFTEKNIRLNNFGLSDKASTGTLYKDSDQSGLASVYKRDLKHHNIEMNISEEIQLETGISYIEKNKIINVNLMKIDVEGHELSVFAGFGDFLHSDNIDFIQFEYGGANLDSHSSLLELHNFLSERGFILCKIMRNSLEIRPYHTRLENFMYQNWVAVSSRVAKM
jgi:FkbM family methyltransferase